jgi:Tol biopolymer transport system component
MLAVAVVSALLTTLLAAPANAAYVGREGRLAFVRGNQIYTISPSGGAATKLTSTGKNYRPKWSPDGRRIVFIHEASTGARDVWVMRANGTHKNGVTHLGDVTAAASWSADGTTLAFGAGSDSFSATLYQIRSTAPFGSPEPMLGFYTGCLSCDDDPTVREPLQVDKWLAWSADGTHIAIFNHVDGGPDDSIFIYDVLTKQAAEYLVTGGECCGFLDWSDFAYGVDGAFGFGEVNTGFDGSDPYVKIVYPGFVSAQGDKSPAPSPSNEHMAFTSTASGAARIYVSDLHGAARHLVTRGYQPDWQPLP